MMRLVYDLFPCQTGSRLRGIGRFSYSLAQAMARLRGAHDFYALANGLYPDSVDSLRQDIGPLLAPGHFAAYTHATPANLRGRSGFHGPVSSALINHAYRALSPDAVVYATPFEGWHEQSEAAIPGTVAGTMRVAVLYDFIPWLFPQQYLLNMNGYKEWYERRLAALHRFDLLLAISDATRNDAIEILGIAPERIVTISGAASPEFRLLQDSGQASQHVARLGIARPFVLYTGNADYRKNLHGMLEAYARLPQALRKTHQLVLNQVGEPHAFRRKMKAVGLSGDEVVVTGRVSDDELVALYARCKVFVFPSLYEGFGLPILEAMACGAPVIAANNSSIPEVVGRADALFDASDPNAIAGALENVLVNGSLRRELRDYGIERAKAFSWDRTARLAWDAIDTALASKRSVFPVNPSLPRIAIVCPLKTGDSPATAQILTLLPALARHFRIDLYMEEGAAVDASLGRSGFAIYPHTQLAQRRDAYFALVYQMANRESHAFMLPLIEQFPGVLILHDMALDVAFQKLAQNPGMESVVESEVVYCHGLQGLTTWRKNPAEFPLLLNRRVLESANYLLLTSSENASLLKQANGTRWLPPMSIMPAGDAMIEAWVQAIHVAAGHDQLHTIRDLADSLQGARLNERALSAIALHATSNWELRRQPRILMDVTQLAVTDARSGIQRVVRNIAREMCALAHLDCPIELVRQKGGKLWRANEIISSVLGLERPPSTQQQLSIHPGDTLLMIDSSWEQYPDFLSIFQAVRRRGGRIVTVVYDTIPLRVPELCVPPLVAVFKRWFRLAVEESDMLLCISRSVADDVRAYLAEHDMRPTRRLQINHWPLGADIGVTLAEASIRPAVAEMAADTKSPLFLMVSTLEPRKNHAFVLDAFDVLWQRGADVRLCIAGKVGWMVDDTMRRVLGHPQLNRKLFFIESGTDAEINLCYSAATGLIAASLTEGFGLPIVEASLHKVPVLASDIPVFREVGGNGVLYFSLTGHEELTAKIVLLSEMTPLERQEMAGRVKVKTWRESAIHLLETVLDGKHAYHHVSPSSPHDSVRPVDVEVRPYASAVRPQPL